MSNRPFTTPPPRSKPSTVNGSSLPRPSKFTANESSSMVSVDPLAERVALNGASASALITSRSPRAMVRTVWRSFGTDE